MSISDVSKKRRASILARLALAALLALMMAILAASSYGARSSYAIPECEVQDPPPICDGPGEPPVPSVPGNDNWANAFRLGSLAVDQSYTDAGNTVLATMEAGEPSPVSPPGGDCGLSGISSTVWYEITPSQDGKLAVSSEGSSYDTVLALYQGTAVDRLTQVACSNANDAPNWTDSMQASVKAGQTYYLQLSGTGGARSGDFVVKALLSSGFVYRRESNPARTEVTDPAGNWLATFTDGSYTVTLKGSSRTFSEQTAAYPLAHSTWVRLLPKPFDGQVDEAWLQRELADTSPDVLQLAMQYIKGAPPIYNDSGLKIAGDAHYGPLQADGTRQEGSDFNDYLGISWNYGRSVDSPEANQIDSLDCSGFVRMVFGYRSRLPLSPPGPISNSTAIPRQSYQMLDSAPGVVTVPNAGTQVTSFAKLAPGDLVFFDASGNDGTRIDHVGVYLGKDTGGNQRFVSSRKVADGPTLGDYGGKSILNGTGLYASSFRAVRRL